MVGMDFSSGSGRSGLRGDGLSCIFAGYLRLLAWIIVAFGIALSGCSGVREDALIDVPEAISPRVRRALEDMQSYVSQAYDAKDKRYLRRLSGLSAGIMACCDRLLGDKDEPGPSAEEWGGVSDEQYDQILKMVETLESHAKWCRDYAKDMQYSRLEGAWRAFIGHYDVFRRVVEDLGS